MGNKTSTSPVQPVADTLTSQQRIEYLVTGLIHSMEYELQSLVPADVVSLCLKYAAYRHHRICILGDTAVGKSALIQRLTCDEFHSEYDPTIEEIVQHTMTVDGDVHNLDIVDTAGLGRREFSPLHDEYIVHQYDTFILCYDISNLHSFETLYHDGTSPLKRIMWRKVEEDVVAVLCVTKIDLVPKSAVHTEHVRRLVAKYQIPVVETSAESGKNVIALFETVIRQPRKVGL